MVTTLINARVEDPQATLTKLVQDTGAVASIYVTSFTPSSASDGSRSATLFACWPAEQLFVSTLYVLDDTAGVMEFPTREESRESCQLLDQLSRDLVSSQA